MNTLGEALGKVTFGKKERHERAPVPTGYGFAYHTHDTLTTVFYPIPLNLAVRLFRWLRTALMVGFYPTRYEQREHDAYQRGYSAGIRNRVSGRKAATERPPHLPCSPE